MTLILTLINPLRQLFFFTAIMISFCSTLTSQNFLSAINAGGEGVDLGTDVAVDEQGNIFISGYFSSMAWFNSTPLISNGCYDQYLVKLNSDHDVLWAKGFGYLNCEYSGGLCIDNAENVYISGRFQIEINLGDTTLYGDGGSDVFVAKFDTDGEFIWAKKLAGPGDESCKELKYGDGNIYISGSFSESANIDGFALTSAGSRDSFLLKLNTAGEVDWIKQGGGLDLDIGFGMDLDDSNNVYLSGRFSDTATFGSFVAESNGQNDVFICKYDENGNELWLKPFGSTSNDFSGGLTADRFGNIYFTGNFNGDFSVDNQNIIIPGADSFILLKFDTDGNLLWIRQDDCSSQCAWLQILIDEFDNIFLSGKFSEQAIFDGDTITSIESGYYKACYANIDEDGSMNWLKHSNFGSCETWDIESLNDSTLISTGSFEGTVDFDKYMLTPLGVKDIFLATLSKGIEIEPPLSSDFLIYPNPTKHFVTVQFGDLQEKKLSIFSSTGSLLHSEIVVTNALTVDMSSLAKGLYLFHIQGQNYQKVSRIIKD